MTFHHFFSTSSLLPRLLLISILILTQLYDLPFVFLINTTTSSTAIHLQPLQLLLQPDDMFQYLRDRFRVVSQRISLLQRFDQVP